MNDVAIRNSFAALQRAQNAQIASLAQDRLGPALKLPPMPVAPPLFPTDTVSFGDRAFSFDDIPLSSDPDYWQKQDALFAQMMQQIATLKALEAAAGIKKGGEGESTAQKGDLNVVAGQRRDGVKAKKVTIHEHRKWSTRQYNENIADYNSHESKFDGAKVGQYYQVNVEWEDGTTTTRDVKMDSPGQTVYIDSQY